MPITLSRLLDYHKNVGTKLGFGSLLLSIVASFGLLAIGGGAGFMWARRKYNKQSVVVMENYDGGANISKTKPNQCRKEPPKWHSMQVWRHINQDLKK